MDLTPYIEQLRRDLLQAAALGDDNTQRIASTLAATASSSARLALMNALSDLAAEITGSLDGTTVEVKLDGQDVRIAIEHHGDYDPDEESDTAYRLSMGKHGNGSDRRSAGSSDSDGSGEDWTRVMKDAGSELSRTTVRLFNELKSQAENAASDQGVSLNTYITRAVADSVKGVGPARTRDGKDSRSKRPGSRSVTGWIQS